MLSFREDAARERGAQICRSAMAMGMASGSGCKTPVTVGVTEATAECNLGTTVSRAFELADQGLEEGKDPVSIEVQAASAF